MFPVMGASGKVGGHTARCLRRAVASVRAIIRDPKKSDAWRRDGYEVGIADLDDAAALATVMSESMPAS
jgi:uncharacterized protein YbjT (DUF2867 family)